MYLQPLFKPRVIDRSGAARLALAAIELGFIHPTTGEELKFETPLPPDLAALVDRLRKS
jgi:23S rRNA pseudouridine1911/1915/1917 synthase